jgi:hypothetical protein
VIYKIVAIEWYIILLIAAAIGHKSQQHVIRMIWISPMLINVNMMFPFQHDVHMHAYYTVIGISYSKSQTLCGKYTADCGGYNLFTYALAILLHIYNN